MIMVSALIALAFTTCSDPGIVPRPVPYVTTPEVQTLLDSSLPKTNKNDETNITYPSNSIEEATHGSRKSSVAAAPVFPNTLDSSARGRNGGTIVLQGEYVSIIND